MKLEDGTTYLGSLKFDTPNYKKGIYVEPYNKQFKMCKEQEEIINFLNDTIKRANRYKKEEKIYPDSIEELLAWEEINRYF